MPPRRRSKRRAPRRTSIRSRPIIAHKARAGAKTAVKRTAKKRKRVSTVTKAKRARPGSRAVKKAVVRNAKAIAGIKAREYGTWQTTNSVLGGIPTTSSPHTGAEFTVNTKEPVMMHLNNCHSDPEMGAPQPFRRKRLNGSFGSYAITQDGLVRDFDQLGQFDCKGVIQKPRRHPSTQYTGNPASTPYPNGKKLRWGGCDLQFKLEGALNNTTLDFYIVKANKQKPNAWDPWNVMSSNPNVPLKPVTGTLPHTINDFVDHSVKMLPTRLNTSRYKILQHKRVFVNNVNRTAEADLSNAEQLKIDAGERHLVGQGGTAVPGMVTHRATTNLVQYVTFNYKANKVVRPLRKFIGEPHDNSLENMQGDANPYEPATIGTMSWDNFQPHDNVWLIITSDHEHKAPVKSAREIELDDFGHANFNAAGQIEYDELVAKRLALERHINPHLSVLRRVWWQDEHTPNDLSSQTTINPLAGDADITMDDGRFGEGDTTRLFTVTNRTEWQANETTLHGLRAQAKDLLEPNGAALAGSLRTAVIAGSAFQALLTLAVPLIAYFLKYPSMMGPHVYNNEIVTGVHVLNGYNVLA